MRFLIENRLASIRAKLFEIFDRKPLSFYRGRTFFRIIYFLRIYNNLRERVERSIKNIEKMFLIIQYKRKMLGFRKAEHFD